MELQSKKDVLANLKTFRVDLTDPMRDLNYREGVLIKGDFGWAEFAPFENHPINHCSRWLQAALEMAWTKLPEPKLKEIKVNAISVSPDPQKAIKILEETGCLTLKVKLSGHDLVKDIEFLRQIVKVKPNIIFRIDFNGSLTLDQALNYCAELTEFNIEYLEQPCGSLTDLKKLKSQTAIKIAVDENLRLTEDATDPIHIREITDIADFVVVKPIPVGGIKRFQKIAEQIIGSGKKIIVSGSMDTSVGLYQTALAQSLVEEKFQLAAGAATGSILSTDVVSNTLKAHNGVLEVKRLEVVETLVKESPNKNSLLKRLDESFEYGRREGWF